MHQKMQCCIICLFLILFSSPALHAFDIKSVTVAGFINLGGPTQDSVNITITRSLTTFLTKISKSTASYRDVEAAALEKGFWKQTNLDPAFAIGIAQALGTEQVIAGDYLVDEKADTILIHVFVYDVVTGTVKLQREYKGGAGLDLFDTIDNMIKDVSGLLIGKKIEIGKLKVSVVPEGRLYKLYVNGSFIKAISRTNIFEDKFIVGQDAEVVLKNISNDAVVFRKSVEIVKDATQALDYFPQGKLMLKIMDGEADVLIDGKPVGKSDRFGDLTLAALESDKEFKVQARKDGKLTPVKTITLAEGETKMAVFESMNAGKLPFNIPVKLSVHGGLDLQAGIEYFVIPNLRAGLYGGFLFSTYDYTNGNTVSLEANFAFSLEAGAAYCFALPVIPLENLKFGAGLSCIVFFLPAPVISPLVNIGAEYCQFFLDAGMRISFDAAAGGIYPSVTFGYRI